MRDLTDPQGIDQALEELAQTADPSGPARVIERLGRAQRRRRMVTFSAGIVAAGAVLVGLNAAGVLGASNTDGDRPVGAPDASSRAGDGYGTTEVGAPCPSAVHAKSVDELKTEVPIWSSNDARLTDAWTCGTTPVLMYGSVQVSYETGWKDVDVQKKWATLAAENGGSVEDVQGLPAYVHPATEAGPRVGVMFVVGDTLVRLLADKDVPVDDVTKLADSLGLPAGS